MTNKVRTDLLYIVGEIIKKIYKGEPKMKDLKKLLNNVVMEFGKNELYKIPTIGWSEENMISRFGEYQYWKNHIIISNYLDTDEVSDRAVESVIYHEYMHQVYREHTEDFEECMNRFDGYDDYYEEVNTYFGKIESWIKEYNHNLSLRNDGQTVFCRLPFNSANFDSYFDGMTYYNHMIIGFLPEDISEKYCNHPIEQIIWTVNYEGVEYIVGWAKNVQLYPSIQVADLTKYDTGRYEYQYKFLQKNGKWLLPGSLLYGFGANEIPHSLAKEGICSGDEVRQDILFEIIDQINGYASDFTEIGFSDYAINDVPAIETENVDLLIGMAKEEFYSHRCVWIMNKVIQLEQNVDTYYWYGRALESMGLFDEALQAYVKALEFENDNEEVKVSIDIVKAAIGVIKNEFML